MISRSILVLYISFNFFITQFYKSEGYVILSLESTQRYKFLEVCYMKLWVYTLYYGTKKKLDRLYYTEDTKFTDADADNNN